MQTKIQKLFKSELDGLDVEANLRMSGSVLESLVLSMQVGQNGIRIALSRGQVKLLADLFESLRQEIEK
jgi:hypothetical protein